MISGYGVSIQRDALPESGGVLDQDNKTMDAFQVIKAEVIESLIVKPKGKKEKDGH